MRVVGVAKGALLCVCVCVWGSGALLCVCVCGGGLRLLWCDVYGECGVYDTVGVATGSRFMVCAVRANAGAPQCRAVSGHVAPTTRCACVWQKLHGMEILGGKPRFVDPAALAVAGPTPFPRPPP